MTLPPHPELPFIFSPLYQPPPAPPLHHTMLMRDWDEALLEYIRRTSPPVVPTLAQTSSGPLLCAACGSRGDSWTVCTEQGKTSYYHPSCLPKETK
jgi:hypothetical protein